MFGLGYGEWLLIFGVLLLLFGGRKLPELARGLGASIREFREAMRSESSERTLKDVTPSKEKTLE
ncbi:MAG: twin-arginine translocase TatA/TatE family subunit [Bacteroidia bacterium]|nr:twin-arginine translocase TatA/TatE family subunit [Bacteroidia bacterium]MCX7651489.1 twin-arginine translocase TatA/TatE family subunit [Bacteroidia bacterium]MDW8416756.1 twin-arginine translocase TatA/TatE family subunit [Bacteroidia bacterium]